MNNKQLTLFLSLLLTQALPADTFISRSGKDSLTGFATFQKKGQLNVVHTPAGNKFVDLADYTIQFDTNGRKPQIIVVPVKETIQLECETRAFEKLIQTAANQGPLCILLDIDTPGGSIGLAQRMSAAITSCKVCPIYAFVSGTKYGGAYSAGALIAQSCHKVYMAENAVMGAAAVVVRTDKGIVGVKDVLGQTAGAKIESAFLSYFENVAQLRDRSPLFVRAMVSTDTEILEVTENEKCCFIESSQRTRDQKVKKTWNKRGQILTLTSVDAIYCGMADDIIAGPKDLAPLMGFDKEPKIVINQELPKIRRDYEREVTVVERLLGSFSWKMEELDILANSFSKAGPNGTRYKEKLRKELFSKLNSISADCNRIRSIQKAYPDMQFDEAGLQKTLSFCDSMRDALNR